MQRFFYATMTLTELLQKEGLKMSRIQKSKIGRLLTEKAKEKQVKYEKKEEPIMVADFPASFIPDMQDSIVEFLQRSGK